MAKNRDYLFYDTTTSICSRCYYPVDAKIIIKNNCVYMDKWCPTHGNERVLMADDADYYRLGREVFVKPPEMTEHFSTPMHYGCPYDCGLCPDHMQHSCLSIVEITDDCNLSCPVCYADSGADRPKNLSKSHRTLSEIEAMFDAIVKGEGEPDVVQISGGEPTIHPDFWAILDMAKSKPIKHLMLNTNGVRIASEEGFAERLATYAPGFEVYLQFDSLTDSTTQKLRGAKLTKMHDKALAKLDELNLSTTLVVTVQQDLNDHEIGAIINKALSHRCCRGVTLQPVQSAGRLSVAQQSSKNRLTVSAVRRMIAEQSDVFQLGDIVPVPCNPDTLAMGYAIRLGDNNTDGNADNNVMPLTRYLDPQTLVEGDANTIVFEHDADFKNRAIEQLFKVMSTNHSPESQANCLSDLLCCLPQIDAPALSYDNVFRIMIVQFMDAHNLDIRALKKSCIHFAQPDGKLIPFESFNLLYRDKNADKLAEIRANIDRSNQARVEEKPLVFATS